MHVSEAKNLKTANTAPESLSDIVDIQNTLIPSLADHERTVRKKSNSLLVLIVTVVLFFSSGVINADVLHVAILVGVLFVHELGHFLMMKALKYNDVRMFFIPFFGAAVSGKTKNNSTLKSCLVSLMGPFPGILLSFGCLVLFGLTHRYVFLKTAEVLLFLNLFNLLPILPFDGGRFLEALFVDNVIARSIYAVFSVLLLAAIAIILEDILFLAIAALSLWSFVGNVNIWKLGVALKKKGLRASSIGELSEDPDTAKDVADSLYAAKPKAFYPKIELNVVYDCFDTIFGIVGFKSLRAIFKALLFAAYLIVFLVSFAFLLYFVFLDYKEVDVAKGLGDEAATVCQIYMAGELASEIPIDTNGLYDGKGFSYESFSEEDQKISSEYYYASGYRTGVWTDYDDADQPVKREEYRDGTIVSESTYADGAWTTIPYEGFSAGRKIKEYLRKVSQPRKSLAPRFEE